MRLFDLAAKYRELSDRLLSSESGELTPADEAFLNSLDNSIAVKVGSIVALRRELGAEVEAMKAESNRLRTLAAARERADERLQRYLIDCMAGAGLDSIKTSIGRVTVAEASRPTIRWEGGIGDIPWWCKRVKTTVSLDSDKALEMYEAEGTLPPGFTVERSKHIRVY